MSRRRARENDPRVVSRYLISSPLLRITPLKCRSGIRNACVVNVAVAVQSPAFTLGSLKGAFHNPSSVVVLMYQ